MAVTTEDILQRLRASLSPTSIPEPQAVNVGTVASVGDGVARIEGLQQAMASELLEFPAKHGHAPVFGMALNLERDSVGAIILGDYLVDRRRRYRQEHRPYHRGAGGRRAAWTRG